MGTSRSFSSAGLEKLIEHEGSIPYVYDDGDGTWPKAHISSYSTQGYPTIGVGHLIRSTEYEKYRPYLKGGGKLLSNSEMKSLLAADVERVSEAPLRDQIQVPITQSMWDALVMQAFNTGAAARSIKNAVAAINREDYDAARDALLNGPTSSKGRYLSALAKRRQYEADLFMADGYPTFFHSIPMAAWIGLTVLVCGGAIGGAIYYKKKKSTALTR
jgi:GH24 family phage-related lysozyme (muramidase)